MDTDKSLVTRDGSQGGNLTHRRSTPFPSSTPLPDPPTNPVIRFWQFSPTLFVATFAFIAICVSYFGYRVVSAKPVDVVNGTQPLSTRMSGIAPTLEQLAKLPAEQRQAALKAAYPKLEGDVVHNMRLLNEDSKGKYGLPANAEVDHVEFLFGSVKDTKAQSGDGTTYQGYFNNQLVARVYLKGQTEPVTAIVECLNGMIATPEEMKNLQSLGNYPVTETFTIEKGWGINRYVGYQTAIDFAEKYPDKLPLFLGKTFDPNAKITIAEARAREPRLGEKQVTVYVVEGDYFDTRTMSFTPSPKRVGK